MAATTARARGGLLDATGDLRLNALTKAYADVLAVDDIELTVPNGSFFALLGPSGCGKTTTLRMVAGLEQPTSGRILLGAHELTGSRPYERPVNTVFQSYALFPHLSVLENVAFGPRRRKVRDAETRARAALALVHMEAYADRPPTQLSGGQQQRVALARAVVNEPQVLLLDEPLGALDLKLRRQMQVELGRLHRELGTTFIHVTHDQEEAMTMADTVALMNAGRIEQLGSPAELYDQPRSVFAANFLGKSNLALGRIEDAAESELLVRVGELLMAVQRRRSTRSAGPVILGVRPEKLVLHPASGPGHPGAGLPVHDAHRTVLGPGRVAHVAFTGVSTEYLVDLPGIGTWSVFAQNLAVASPSRPGDEVWVSWDARHTFGLDLDGARDHAGHLDLAVGTPERDDADGQTPVPATVGAHVGAHVGGRPGGDGA